ncbi:MAG: xylose isomerase [Thiotrichales bacterium]|nr:xylose isomerase [Thiotrichales bacterium]
MQKLEIFQSIWAMERRRPDGHEWAPQEQIEMIAEAGYAGLDLMSFAPDVSRPMNELLLKHGLGCTCSAFPKSVEGFQSDIDLALELGARHLNVIGQMYPLTVAEGADIIKQWLDMADKAGQPVTIETHRDCITTDMLYTLQLMEAVPEMQLCADLSHFVVGREFSWPVPDRDEQWIVRVLDRSASFQGRVASREQVQVQIEFPQHQHWVEKFKQWWRDGFCSWRRRQPADATLNFLVELGPPPYAITDKDGWELSDRWQESLTIKGWVEDIWQSSGTSAPDGD